MDIRRSIMANYSDFKPKLDRITRHIIPHDHEGTDLGHSTKAFRDLYLSGSSLHLGSAVINSVGSGIALPAGTTIGGSAPATEAAGGLPQNKVIAFAIALG
jgi:hypothetical protein